MKLFLSPHNDDECLFGSFTIIRERPVVAIVFDSHIQQQRGHRVTADMRRKETLNALSELAFALDVRFVGLSDADPHADVTGELRSKFHSVEHVWAPAIEDGGHDQHNAVGRAASLIWPGMVTYYMTYTRTDGKSRGEEVPIVVGDWVRRKLRALSCYATQINIEALGCREHFLRDQKEYYQPC